MTFRLNKKIIIPILILILLPSLFLYFKKGNKNNLLYEEVPIKRGNIQISILATGTVNPNNRLEIKSPIAGRAEKVLVEEGQKIRKGQNLVLVSSSERAALIDAARLQGPEEIKKWEDLYKVAPITSPIHGTVIYRQVEPGQSFTTSEPILVLSDRLVVKAQVDETDVAQIRLHQRAKIILDAYPDKEFEGRVLQIAFDAKTINNVTTYIVDVLPLKTPDFMRSGMTTNVNFDVTHKENILLIPNKALKNEGERLYVLVRDPHDRSTGSRVKLPPSKKYIQTGLKDGVNVELLETLGTDALKENDFLLVPLVDAIKKKSLNNASPFSPYANKKK